MKNALLIIILIIVIAALGFGGWYYFIRKSAEGGSCTNDSRCEQGLKCLNKTCSSGKKGSSCSQKSDCTTGYCVNNLCTEGKKDDACKTHNDCQKGLLCQKSICATPPDYSKYFDKIIISKMKPGMGPGPNNPTTVTDTFKTTDAIEIDFGGVKPTTIGEVYYEMVDPITGEVVRTSKNEIGMQKLEGQDRGTGTSLSNLSPGEYDLNIYFNNELVYSTPIKITQ